jgi:hypothetical protein
MTISGRASTFGREQGPVAETPLERDLRRLALVRDRQVAAARRRRSSAVRTVILRGGAATSRLSVD